MALSSALVRAFFHPGMLSVAAISALSLASCGGTPETVTEAGEDESVATVSEAIVGNPIFDDSASPVHVVGAICGTTVLALSHTIDCTLPAGYVLVGGGARTDFENTGALTASYPLTDNRTWRAASKTPTGVTQTHRLSVQVIGIRLDGVNVTTLKNMMLQASVSPSVPGTSSPGLAMGIGPFAFGGGASATTNGVGQFLTQLAVNGGSWSVGSRDYVTSSPGWITGFIRQLNTTGVIEGFGAIEFQRLSGAQGTTASSITVSDGWGLVGLGATVTTTSGPGLLLHRIAMGSGPRDFVAATTSSGQSSPGTVTAQLTQIRKTPDSHGLCNSGAKLSAGMDSCVANVCAQDSFCCDVFWDSICVGEVGSICGRSCADHSCSQPSYNQEFWNKGGPALASNTSYNYALNRRTDTNAKPGRAAGAACVNCSNVTDVAKSAAYDGLIPTTLAAGCTDGRSLVAFAVGGPSGNRWYRQDTDGTWSFKLDSGLPVVRTDASNQVITNIESADRWPFLTFGGYFCACSDAMETNGHTVIN